MRFNIILAVGLIVLGAAALMYRGITYTSRENVVDVGSVHVSADRSRTLPLSPILGVAAILGGGLLLVLGNKKT